MFALAERHFLFRSIGARTWEWSEELPHIVMIPYWP